MEIVPRKENSYWKHDQVGVRPKDMPVAFYSFVRLRALELGSNTSPLRILEDDQEEQGPAWEGPCMMGDLCGGSHAPEKCCLFKDLSPEDRLVVVQKKRLCYLCFWHADNQPCKLQSLLACSVGGCVRMHSKLLHEALQKEETRAIVIEVEEGPEEPGEDEEFYAANFELLGQEDEDEEEGMVSEDEAPPLLSSEEDPDDEPSPLAHLGEDRPRLCQQRVPLEVNMVTDGWGRDLLPPDNASDNQAGVQGGAAEQSDVAQEVRLPEYRGWSQGTWSHENGSGPGAASLRGGCLGARPKSRGVTVSGGASSTQRKTNQGSGSRGPSRESRDPPTPQVRFGAAHPQVSRGARSRFRMIPPPKKRPSPNPSPTPGRGSWSRGGSSGGSRSQSGAARMQPPRRPPLPDPGRMPGPLQLMGPGDHPMQRLALMMAVMMLGMPPVNGCHTSVGPGEQGARDQAEPMIPPSAWFGDSRGTPTTERGVGSAARNEAPPVEPGGFPIRRILQQVQWSMESLTKIKEEVQRAGQEATRRNPEGREWNPGSGESGQDSRPKREAAQKAMDALKKGADATRGRGRRKGRMYQRAGVRN
jgi:hypothetical protein